MTITPDIRVLYNNTCPICSREVAVYRAQADAEGRGIAFDGLERAVDWGLTPDQAAQAFHVVRDGQLLSGMAAFRVLWAELPRWRWLARMTGLPLIRPSLDVLYTHVAAPLLYAMHKRRMRQTV